MKTIVLSLLRLTVGAFLGLGLIPAARAQDTAFVTGLYYFDGIEGGAPGQLVQGSDGNFYGTTGDGGFGYNTLQGGSGYGTVFRLTPADGLTTLYVFPGGAKGQNPFSLIQGSDGNFYGLTEFGGTAGNGTVFRLTPAGELTTVYNFGTRSQAAVSLLQASDGNFYGLTSGDGVTGEGAIFRLTPDGVYTTLYAFTGGNDGRFPASLLQASDGNFYGATDGGADNSGTIFQVTPMGTLTTLYTFTGGDDGSFLNGLIQGSDGNFYGTTRAGGPASAGVVFRLTPAGGYSVLYAFSGDSNGVEPIGNLAEGADGNFYGATSGGVAPVAVAQRRGARRPAAAPDIVIDPASLLPATVFRITPQGTITTLYADSTAVGGFLLGRDGNFYGTDDNGGYGSVFELSVVRHPAFFTYQAALNYDVYYLSFANGNIFGYYNFSPTPGYLYHLDLGPEYFVDANDGKQGLYLYDFRSSGWFYTSPTFGFPYLYDFSLQSVVYYFPDPSNPGRYNTDGVRFFYDFATGTVIAK